MSDQKDPVLEKIENTKAVYRRLGKSGLRVSVPILGAMSFGDPAWQPWILDEEASLPLLKAAHDRGINSWDTANIYSNGVSETIIGKAIKKYQIPREKIVILSKCFAYIGEEPGIKTMTYGQKIAESPDYVNQGGLSRTAIFNAVNKSLQRLDLEYLDLLQIHRFDPNTPIEETMEALHDLVRSGKVRYIGASSMWTYQFCMMQACADKNGWTKFVSMQNQYSLLYREEEREMNKYCDATGVGLIPAEGLAGTSEVDVKTIGRVQELAEKKGWKMAHVALAWINKRVSSPIIGFSSVERMDEALGANDKTLTEDEEKYLEELYQPRNIVGHS
ncbi:unnamed protein product [Aureobasidium vineae]|uniref:NADP-dependent oxidoreductase domain-containing protein n=1 Tax=Aureobasidium vineae TaxID=2773715 RepID=A0A9N8K0A7_9PEZI|nr:unnamed protein product [Aureobasidium vineae]